MIDRAQRERREIKYLIREDTALQVRSYVSSYLEPDEFAAGKPGNSYDVHSLYLDSDDLMTYRAVADGERNRFKLRIRYYDREPASPVFFEIKRRLNDVICKQRARVRRGAVEALLAGESPTPKHLHAWNPRHWFDLLDFCRLVSQLEAAPRAHNFYRREAYVSTGRSSVRVTMDRDVRIGPEFGGSLPVSVDQGAGIFLDLVILELKFTERMPTWMVEMVRGFELNRTGAAKYARGVEALGISRVARRQTGFVWGTAVTNAATSAPWLDASAELRGALGPDHR
jgi:hypothetical protein